MIWFIRYSIWREPCQLRHIRDRHENAFNANILHLDVLCSCYVQEKQLRVLVQRAKCKYVPVIYVIEDHSGIIGFVLRLKIIRLVHQ